jgi:hypothetical protein
MTRKRKSRQNQDLNQLMLFTPAEMSGEASVLDEENASSPPIAEMNAEAETVTVTETETETETEAEIDSVKEAETIESTEKPSAASPIQFEHLPASDDDTVKLLVNIMKFINRMDAHHVRLLAMQAAALMQGDVDPQLTYKLPALEGLEFRGLEVSGLAYVSIARSFPNMIDSIGLDWDKAYQEALKLI